MVIFYIVDTDTWCKSSELILYINDYINIDTMLNSDSETNADR